MYLCVCLAWKRKRQTENYDCIKRIGSLSPLSFQQYKLWKLLQLILGREHGCLSHILEQTEPKKYILESLFLPAESLQTEMSLIMDPWCEGFVFFLGSFTVRVYDLTPLIIRLIKSKTFVVIITVHWAISHKKSVNLMVVLEKKVRVSPKSVWFIIWQPCMPAQNLVQIHPVYDEIFQWIH